MNPVVSDSFELELCGMTSFTIPAKQWVRPQTGVCISKKRCEDPACVEPHLPAEAPIIFELDGQHDVLFVHNPVRVTSDGERTFFDLRSTFCEDGLFTVRAWIPGKSEQTIRFEGRCVPDVEFEAATAMTLAADETPVAITTFPSPPLIATLSERGDATVVSLIDPVQGQVVATQTFANEIPRGIHGFFYDVRNPASPDVPLLAVATSTVVTGRGNQAPRLRLMSFSNADGLQLVQQMDGFCHTCGCQHQPFCEGCSIPPPTDISCTTSNDCDTERACEGGACECVGDICRATECFSGFTSGTRTSIRTADANGDGFADLFAAPNTGFLMTRYLSAPHRHQLSSGQPPSLPPLEEVCACYGMGKVLKSFDLLDLGGPGDGIPDLIMGDPTGAFLRYAEDTRHEGAPCDPSASNQTVCPEGHSCVESCPGSQTGECLIPCDVADPSNCSGRQPECLPLDGPEGQGPSYCAGPILGCRQPSSVWKLTGVSQVVRFEDECPAVIAAAQGSSVPGNLETARIRIVFGCEADDLTRIDNEPLEVRRAAVLDLDLLQPPPPTGARAVQTGHFNGDDILDFAVLFGTSEEIRVFLGGGRVPQELAEANGAPRPLSLSATTESTCFPMDDLLAADFDGDGRDELLVLCNTPPEGLGPATLLRFSPR